MAVLKEDNLSVDVKFTDYRYRWVYYDFRFFLGALPIFNPAIHEGNFFLGNEHRGDTLISTLEQALSEDKDTAWEPTEPDMWIDIEYQKNPGWGEYERYLKDKTVGYVSDDYKETLKEVDEERKKAGGKLPNDCFQLTFFVDSLKLKQPDEKLVGYTGDGIGLRITVTREKLMAFVQELKVDYQKFLEAHKEDVRTMYKEVDLPSPI